MKEGLLRAFCNSKICVLNCSVYINKITKQFSCQQQMSTKSRAELVLTRSVGEEKV